MSIVPNVSAETFSLSAVVVGYLLIDDLTANEQNAIGNWLMLTAQVLCTNAYYQQVQAERANKNINSKETCEMLEKMVKALNKEIEEIKKKIM